MWILGFLIGLGMLAAVGLFAAGGVIAARHVASQWHSLDKRQRRRCTALFLAFAFLVLGIANGIALFTVATAIGGNADRVEGGRYFVSSHGRLTEVSQAVWNYSDWHGRFTWLTSVIAAFAIAVIMYLNWLVERERPSLKIIIARDGAILINDQPASMEEVIERAELAKARREPIYLKHDYPPDAVPTEAVKLHHELIGHEILFQAVEHTK